MSRFVIWVLVAAGTLAFLDHHGVSVWPSFGSTGVEEEGAAIQLSAGDLDVSFRTVGALDDVFMVFGGAEMRQRNAISHAMLAGLPSDAARALAASYPDFHLCASPGATRAKELTRPMNFVAATPRARDALGEALELHEQRVRSGGERTCLAVSGAPLILDGVRVRANGEDLTADVSRAFGSAEFVLARSAEVVDCESVLR